MEEETEVEEAAALEWAAVGTAAVVDPLAAVRATEERRAEHAELTEQVVSEPAPQ